MISFHLFNLLFYNLTLTASDINISFANSPYFKLRSSCLVHDCGFYDIYKIGNTDKVLFNESNILVRCKEMNVQFKLVM